MLLTVSPVVVIVLICISGLCADNESIEQPTKTDTPISKLFRRKCIKNADINAHMELMEASKALQQCFDKAVPSDIDASEAPDIVCGEGVPVGYQCLTTYVEKLQRCLDPVHEQHVPEMLQEFYNGTMKEICKHQDNIEEYKKNYDVFQATVFILFFGNMLDPCLNNTNFVQKLDKPDFIIEKHNICSDIEFFKQCLLARFPKDKGEGFELPANFLTSLFNNYLDSCSTERFNNYI